MKTCDSYTDLSSIWMKNRDSLVVTCKWNPGPGEGIDKKPSVATRSRMSSCTDGNK